MTFRPGHAKVGGRVKGKPNRTTIERHEALQRALESCADLPEGVRNMTPLACLLTAMRYAWHLKDFENATRYAEIACPYVHPKLASADLTVRNTDVSKSDAELAAELAEIREKAAAAATKH
jgi:hypothetical protein